jgi:hypothetical protein
MAGLVWTKLNVMPAALVLTGLTVAAWGMYQKVVQPNRIPKQDQNRGTPSRPSDPELAKDAAGFKTSLEQLQRDRDSLKVRLDSANHDATNVQWAALNGSTRRWAVDGRSGRLRFFQRPELR